MNLDNTCIELRREIPETPFSVELKLDTTTNFKDLRVEKFSNGKEMNQTVELQIDKESGILSINNLKLNEMEAKMILEFLSILNSK